MAKFDVRPATEQDLPAITAIYNHYVIHTPVTFDLEPVTMSQRRLWFDEHGTAGPHRILVAMDARGVCAGYASSSTWRPKAAYDTTVETSVYCDPTMLGQGCGTALYSALFDSLADEDLCMAVAGVTLPNDASVMLHRRFGFMPVGVFQSAGRKFGCLWDVEWFQRPFIPAAKS
jgi:phosphinothricin acetyltransferase